MSKTQTSFVIISLIPHITDGQAKNECSVGLVEESKKDNYTKDDIIEKIVSTQFASKLNLLSKVTLDDNGEIVAPAADKQNKAPAKRSPETIPHMDI